MKELIYKVVGWHRDRNLIDGASDKDQVCKLIQEVGELSDNVCKGKDIRDDIGDIMVVLINIAERNKVSLEECLLCAWNDIKDRKGKMVDGIFVKEADKGTPTEEKYAAIWDYDLQEYYYDGDKWDVEYVAKFNPAFEMVLEDDPESEFPDGFRRG